MLTKLLNGVLLLAINYFLFADHHALAESRALDTQGTKRALLIGINKYRAVPRLQGSLNDIETMRQVLLMRWGFSDTHVKTVTDEAATRVGILAALEQLVNESKSNDIVYVHYSGHGSQVEDLNGDEPDDHLDETLVPQDGRTGEVRDITDDELDAIFARMPAKTAFIVLDSCHSGTATRSVDIRTRSIPPDTRVEIYRKAESALPKSRAIVPVVTSRYVVMTGAASHQEALDGPLDGRFHGFFTYALSKSLGSASLAASPRDVLSGVERELKRIQTHFGRPSMPEPQLEAPPELIDKTLLGTAFTTVGSSTRLPWATVQPAEGGQILLVNGYLIGATPGSMWSLYPPGETQFLPGRALAVATVSQTIGKDAQATVHSVTAKLQPGWRAVLLLPAPIGQRIPIRLQDVPSEQRKAIEDTIKANLKDADLVDETKPARFLIDLRGKALRLLTADGLQVVASFALDEPWGSGLATVVSRSANASEIVSLDNPSSQLKIEVHVTNAGKPPQPLVQTRGVAVVAADMKAAQYRIRKVDEPRTQQNSLQLEIRVNTDSYVTIVDVDSEGGVNLLFPNTYQSPDFWPNGFIRANESVLIPDSLQSEGRAGFYWDYSPPKGTDTIRVFASTDLQTAQMIRDRVQTLQKGPVQVGTRAVSSTVRTLRESLSTRGIIRVHDSTPHVPGPVSSAGGQNKTQVVPDPAPPALSDVPITTPLDPTTTTNQPPASSAPDWAATSVTIAVHE